MRPYTPTYIYILYIYKESIGPAFFVPLHSWSVNEKMKRMSILDSFETRFQGPPPVSVQTLNTRALGTFKAEKENPPRVWPHPRTPRSFHFLCDLAFFGFRFLSFFCGLDLLDLFPRPPALPLGGSRVWCLRGLVLRKVRLKRI